VVYIGDIIVMGRSFTEHMQNAAMMFQRLMQAGLKLKTADEVSPLPGKSNFLWSCGIRQIVKPDPG